MISIRRTIIVYNPGGTPYMKGLGMLVVSLRGINFGFWSHLGCSGQNAIIFSREGLVQGCTRKIYIVCVLTWSLLGVKKAWATPRSVCFRALIQNFRRASHPFYIRIFSPPPGANKLLKTCKTSYLNFKSCVVNFFIF